MGTGGGGGWKGRKFLANSSMLMSTACRVSAEGEALDCEACVTASRRSCSAGVSWGLLSCGCRSWPRCLVTVSKDLTAEARVKITWAVDCFAGGWEGEKICEKSFSVLGVGRASETDIGR